MSENANKRRLIEIGGRVKRAREGMGLTQEQFADKYGYARTTIGKLEAGHRDFKSTEIVTLAEQLNVSCDYLLGRTRAAAPDDFIQEAVKRYGLSEQALKHLEQLNEPLDIDVAEQERVVNKQLAYENAAGITNENIGIKRKIKIIEGGKNLIPKVTEEGRKLLSAPPLTAKEFQTLTAIIDDEICKQALAMLDAMLTTPTGRKGIPEWETCGLMILKTAYDYCYRAYLPIKQSVQSRAGIMAQTIDADRQRALELHLLNESVALLRSKLIRTVHMKPLQAHVTEEGREFFDKIKQEENEDA
jgi:transcriptional regulator with XRE-family HTH domain